MDCLLKFLNIAYFFRVSVIVLVEIMTENSPNNSSLSRSLNDTVEESDDYESDQSLEIITVSPKVKTKRNTLEISTADKSYLTAIEQELDKLLDEKAAKNNLTVQNVKNLLRHVVSNEHLLALVKQVEDPENYTDDLSQFEPKLTRAKAKELFLSQPSAPLPSWISPPIPASETQVLINEDLPDDDSEEEYVPTATGEDESEDDRDTSVISESDPATPHSIDSSTQTTVDCFPSDNVSDNTDVATTSCSIVEDGGGVFKIPTASAVTPSKKDKSDEANIALRTRSKLCLSNTPLEVIEEAFIPPDITTDMYDMECDDEEWTDFLRGFTRPLDEVAKPRDDEEHDPEYNILEDDRINKIDKEELRADRAVEVTKKELNDLIAELFDYTNNFDDRENDPPTPALPTIEEVHNIQVVVPVLPPPEATKAPDTTEKEFKDSCYTFQPCEIHLLRQQMRQHVQLLAQGFVLSHLHPEYGDSAEVYKEYLYNVKQLPVDLQNSIYNVCNLNPAIDFVENWSKLLANKSDPNVIAHFDHVARVLNETRNHKSIGREYIPKFSKLVLHHVSQSEAFLYPTLLPCIPSVPRSTLRKFPPYSRSEEELIAVGLEQFIPYLSQDKRNLTPKKEVKMTAVAHYLQCYMLPTKQADRIYRYIIDCQKNPAVNSPIAYYFDHKVSPSIVHYVIPMEDLKSLPPCKRPLEQLPDLWKQYVATLKGGNIAPQIHRPYNIAPSVPSLRRVTKPPQFNSATTKRQISPRKRRTKEVYQSCSSKDFSEANLPTSTPNFQPRRLEDYFETGAKLTDFKFNSSVFKNLQNSSMPQASKSVRTENISQDNNATFESVSSEVLEVEDTAYRENSTLTSKINGRKSRISLAEKRKQKVRKEFNANLNMLLPDQPHVSEEKTNIFVQAFYDKVRDQLDLPDYHKFIEILNDFDEEKHTAQELYKNVVAILENKYPDIAEEFLAFLTTAQAKSLGKLVPHFMLGNMSFFLRRLEMYFKEQPSQVKKIYHALAELSEVNDITMEQVKSTILPLLKGNALIIDWFLQFFPSEKPSQKLLNGPWEMIELGKDSSVPNTGEFETIIVPEVDDPYGGINCICSCHETDSTDLKSRLKHCVPCGTKFLQGRVYIQTGKGLRLAKISFSDDDTTDNYARLVCKTTTTKRRSDSSPSKQISPNKDHNDEGRNSNDSDDDITYSKKKHVKSPRKRKLKTDLKPLGSLNTPIPTTITTTTNNNPTTCYNENVTGAAHSPTKTEPPFTDFKLNQDRSNVDLDESTILLNDSATFVNESTLQEHPVVSYSTVANVVETETVKTEGMDEHEAGTAEWDCNTSIESMELRLSPDHEQDIEQDVEHDIEHETEQPSAESESEFCEETSQDNINSDSEDSVEEMEIESTSSNSPGASENSNTGEEICWTRDEDKVLLQTLQSEGGTEDAFKLISERLENRTITQVKQRFNTLLSLIRKMTDVTS